jgi:hypothetical protein
VRELVVSYQADVITPQSVFLSRLADIERRIAILLAMRNGLRRAMIAANSLNEVSTRDIRTPTIDRQVIELGVLEALSGSDQYTLSTRELFEIVRRTSPTLKYVTFRSCLSRLKQRGHVANTDTRGHWSLPPNQRQMPTPNQQTIDIPTP